MKHKTAITGIGVVTALGQGKDILTAGLRKPPNVFNIMAKPGRQTKDTRFIGAEIDAVSIPKHISPKLQRSISWTAKVALTTLGEAWVDAMLEQVDPYRIGLIIGGTNLQQREITLMQEQCQSKIDFLRPIYGMMHLDTDLVGLCTQEYNIRGLAHSVGGASSSGHLAVIHAAQAVLSGQVDVCIAMGALTDISYWECQGFRALQAMGSEMFAHEPSKACRPFDKDHDGFIFGESCGAVVIERAERQRANKQYAQIAGSSITLDGNRNPNPTLTGEIRAIRSALSRAEWKPEDVEYVNTHGTASVIGDITELTALKECGLTTSFLNATKSITGHGISSAGTVEIIATILQMHHGFLHPTRNLEQPIDKSFRWILDSTIEKQTTKALSLSFGFGGINSAICLQKNLR